MFKGKPFKELQLRDDFMFGKVMENEDLCQRVLETLLQRKIGKLTTIESQREIRITEDGKPIRLDIYSEDDSKEIYDAEMQNLNNHAVIDLELSKRSRYYQNLIDTNFLKKNMRYRELPDCNVIFICTFDPFEKGEWEYRFENTCNDRDCTKLNDGTVKYFFNTTAFAKAPNESIRNLLCYFQQSKVNDELTDELDAEVQNIHSQKNVEVSYMKEILLMQEAKDEGIEIGKKEVLDALLKNGSITEDVYVDMMKKL